MSGAMLMIMPPPPPLSAQRSPTPPPLSAVTKIPDEFRDSVRVEPTPVTVTEFRRIQERCPPDDYDKDGKRNDIQKLLAESTAAIAHLNTAATISQDPLVNATVEEHNQEDDQPVKPMTILTDGTEQQPSECEPAPSPRIEPYPGVNQILPSLFLCSAAAARVNILEHLKIRLVINLAPELIVDTPLPNPKPIYLRIPVMDKGNVDLKQFFDETCDLIEDVRQSGGRTLIHCVAGVSRSAAIVIAYLMKHQKMSLREAFKHTKWARPQIRPNCGFFRQLISYELELTGVQTVHFVMLESIAQEVPDVYEPEYKAMEQFYQRHRHRHVRKRD